MQNKLYTCSGRSRPSDKGGPGHPDPEIRVRVRGPGLEQIFFVWSKNKGGEGVGPPGPSPGSATDM